MPSTDPVASQNNASTNPFESKSTLSAVQEIENLASHNQKSHPITTFSVRTTEAGGPRSKAQAKIQAYTSDPTRPRFPRLSRPVELLRTSYDVVVIGSGYGGGVAASRMARGRQSVCLLERGKEKWPGEYPSSLRDVRREVHVTGDFTRDGKRGGFAEGGDPTGLYHFVVGDGQNTFVGNGLGGTSLLNANVFLEMDPRVMKFDMWPEELKKKEDWDKYYSRARSMLEPATYPLDYPVLPKLRLLEKQAELVGLKNKFYRAPQTTRFLDGPNSTGIEMQASALTGQDATGINDGSKSSTLVNYLSDAWNWGAEMFCECEVRHIKKAPDGEGYIVYFAWYGSKRGVFKNYIYKDLMWIHARKCVFLGAGSLGTTEILLRSKEMGLNVSDKIGTGISGNGDLLAFGYNTNYEVNSVGNASPSAENPIGPCINGVIDCRDQLNPLDGFIIEEGSIPEALSRAYQTVLETMPTSIPRIGLPLYQKVEKFLASLGSKVFGPYFRHGSIQKTQVYLVMSHDSNQACLTLKNDKPLLKILRARNSENAKQINELLAKATEAVGGTFLPGPFLATPGHQEMTVHPLGGAGISNDGTGLNGGTNHIGEVFDGNGEKVHEGLVVCDGAFIPASLGVNPFATITALAERSVELIAKGHGINIDYETKNGILNLFGRPQFPIHYNTCIKETEELITNAANDGESGIGFSEVMSGYVHIGSEVEDFEMPTQHNTCIKEVEELITNAANHGESGIGFSEVMSGFVHIGNEIEDFEMATKIAQSQGETAKFFLSIKSWNTKDHNFNITGTFSCAGLKDPFMVLRGDFRLFNQDPGQPDTDNLTYSFDMISPSEEKFCFNGYKIINPSIAFDPLGFWKATSTLYVTITRPEGSVIGRGTLKIQPGDFALELKTLVSTGVNWCAKAKSFISFFHFITAQSAKSFFAPFSWLSYPNPMVKDYINVTAISQTYKIAASDGVMSTMQMWDPIGKGSHDAAPTMLFIPGAAVDHQIFALPTIEKNAIDYFREAGYRCFCVTHRVGKTMVAYQGYTTFDARLDIASALSQIRKLQETQTNTVSEKVYVVAHCVGSLALSCGLLDGTIPAEYIKGITASNVFMTPIFAKVNKIKANQPIPMNRLYSAIVGSWFSCMSSTQDGLMQQAINQLLRFYPVGGRREICNSVVCHRSSLVFGRLWSHRNLNAATHSQLSHFLGGTSMSSLAHLMLIGRAGHVTTSNPNSINLVTPFNMTRLQGIPILFFSGSENTVFDPQSTDISYTMLRDTFGEECYERVVFEGRGHLDCWIGKDAADDVYPRVRKHVDQVMKGKN